MLTASYTTSATCTSAICRHSTLTNDGLKGLSPAVDEASTTCEKTRLRAIMTTHAKNFHVKCRFPNEYVYKGEDGQQRRIVRHEVPAGFIAWDVQFDHYDPISFSAPVLNNAPWADPRIASDTSFKFNEIDGKIDRKSYEGRYLINKAGEPLNIRGRTGLKGRGVLGRWGPNHAADPIVTRWKRDSNGDLVLRDGKRVLQFVSIQRRDTGDWAIPGGMVDPGEAVSQTVRREFMEEALDSTTKSREEVERMENMVKDFFKDGVEIYSGYVDDPRNTDNAWMETTAFLFHDETGEKIGKFELKAGDDAKALEWRDLDGAVRLYASHEEMVKKAVDLLEAYW